MEIRRYSSDDDDTVASWCRARDVPAAILDLKPDIGLIAPGIAVGFLYQTDSPVALIEGIITNPDASQDDRATGVRSIMLGLFDIARDLGFTYVWGYTTRPEMAEHGVRIGFRKDPKPYTLGVKKLR